MKKLAIVCSAWHYPAHFFESMVKQIRPEGWEIDFFAVSHRNPSFALEEKKGDVFKDDLRGRLDSILYKEIATESYIKQLGWNYKEYPNTIGDWGNTNQWLDEHNYKDYDLFLFTHDDNLIIHDRVISDTIEDPNFKKWDILTNSPGMPPGTLRGSFEFFKPKVLKLLNGKFDMSMVSLTREGKTDSPKSTVDLYDWNNTIYPLTTLIEKNKLKVAYLSPAYRVSAYCIEGERGYISQTHGQNTQYEDAGLKYLQDNGII